MKRKSILAAALALCAVAAHAQDIYQVAELSAADLYGTSRYVAMGGAMGALGGDLSTMATSPAATALYRRSDVAVTASLVTQPGGHKFDDHGNTHASFDQLGFLYALHLDDDGLQYINLGVNYHKQRDFNQLTASTNQNLADAAYASQTWQLSDLANYWGGSNYATPLTEMATQAQLLDPYDNYAAYGASSHYYNKARWGSNQAYDFNVSLNINDQGYLGATATAYNVIQKSTLAYTEDLVTSDLTPDGYYTLVHRSKLDGFGYDVKIGILIRPVLHSNFKVGLTFTSPIFYDLTYRYDAYLSTYENQWGDYDIHNGLRYDYKVRTPWKIALALGNTFFNRLALDAEYEYADYSNCSVSYGDIYDDWYSSKDHALNDQPDQHLKGTHTLRLGAELMICPALFLRAGYNLVTTPFDNDAYLDQYINSASIDAATTTDYLNTSNINRYTLGLGLKLGNFYADASWLYQNQHANLYTFSASQDGTYFFPASQNTCPPKRVQLNKTQLALTLGYRF